MAVGDSLNVSWNWAYIVLSWFAMFQATWFAAVSVSEARFIGNVSLERKSTLQTGLNNQSKMFIVMGGIGFSFCGVFSMHYSGMVCTLNRNYI